MTKEQSKAHWWIVENHPDFRIEPPKKYFEICDIVFNALKQGQSLPIPNVCQCNEQLMAMLTSRVLTIQSEPDGIVRETMINNLLIDINCA